MSYIGWPTDVNQYILDSTTITLGDGATKTDTLETGKTKSRMLVSSPSKKYQVVMDFDWRQTVKNGLSEWDIWHRWYQYKLKCSQNYFSFPSIIMGENSTENEWYRITSAPQAQKQGEAMRVTMTWETVYEGQITVSEDTNLAVDYIYVNNLYNRVTAILVGTPETIPTQYSFAFTINGESKSVYNFSFDSNKTITFTYDKITAAGDYLFSYGGKTAVIHIL